MKIIKKNWSPSMYKDFYAFKSEENSESVGFIETKDHFYMVRFDILDDFTSFTNLIKDTENFLCCYYPGETTLRTLDKNKYIQNNHFYKK